MKLKLIIILLIVSICNSNGQSITLHFRDGSLMNFDLNENIQTKFNNGEIQISSATLAVSYPLSDVQKYTFSNTSNITDFTDDCILVLRILDNGNLIKIENLKNGTNIDIYSFDGKLVNTIKSESTEVNIDLSTYAKGMYICKINEISYKLIKS